MFSKAKKFSCSKFPYFKAKGLQVYALVVLATILLSFRVDAQNGQPLGFVRDESKQGIDLYTGRTNFSVPVAQFKGRGEAGGDLSVSIPQPQWQVAETQRVYHPTTGQVVQISYGAFPAGYVGGEASPAYLTPARIQVVTRGTPNLGWGFFFHNAIANVIEFTTSDGTKIELRDVNRNGEFSPLGSDVPNYNCFVQTYDNQTPFPQPLPQDQIVPPSSPLCNRGTVFKAVDGSGITFVADENIYDKVTVEYRLAGTSWETVYTGGFYGKTKGTLYMPDGTKYRFGSVSSDPNVPSPWTAYDGALFWIEDRNGNRTTMTYLNDISQCDPLNGVWSNACGKLVKITDSVNREITIAYGDSQQDSYFDTVTYKGYQGGTRQVKINYNKMQYALRPDQTLKTGSQLFPTIGTVMANSNSQSLIETLDKYKKIEKAESFTTEYLNPKVMTSIVLPNNQQYTFQYNSYGELARTISPLGGYTDFEYGAINHSGADAYGVLFVNQPELNAPRPDRIYRRGTEVKVSDSAGNLQAKTTYSGAGGMEPVIVKQFDGDGTTLLSAIKHYFYVGADAPSVIPDYETAITHFSWKQNREYKTEALDPANLNNVLRKTELTWEQSAPVAWWGTDWYDGYEPQNDPRVTEVKTTLETGQVTKKTFAYDQYSNVTDTYEYDYGDGQTWQLLRRTHTDFVTGSNYINANLRSLPLQSWVSSDAAGNNKTSLKQYEYDVYSGANHAALFPRTDAVNHNTNDYGAGNTVRGNVTAIKAFPDVQNANTAITSYTHYDVLGNVVETIDSRGKHSTFYYDDNFGTPNGEARSYVSPTQLNGLKSYAYATRAVNPAGFTGYSQFDYFSGLTVDEEDLNGNVSTIFYNDILDRPTQTISANNRSDVRTQVTTVYNDNERKTTVTADLYSFGDNIKKTETYYDTLGRITETRNYEAAGYAIVNKPQYDALGRVTQSTRPYRPYLGEQPAWTTTSFDELGRVEKVKTPDNMEAVNDYSGNVKTAIDQIGKKRRSITNAIGQVVRVDEPNFNNELGDVSNPAQPTSYSYNTNGQLVKVSQGQQNRYFLYDALGRLIRIKQPEQDANSALTLTDPITGNDQWSAASTYDASGNMLTSTDARGVVVTNTYDDLNRLLTRAYSDGTPTVTFEYDNSSVPFGKGQMTKVSSTVSETRYTSYDPAGRIKSSEQLTTPEQRNGSQAPWTMAYAYNLSGALVEETYPSGRVVKNNFDNDGKVQSITGKSAAQADFHAYADNFVYTATGLISSMRMGNGRWESTQYNLRSQVEQIGLGTSRSATNLLKINYEYGELDGSNQLKNNGNLHSQTIKIAGLTDPFIQTYKYDSVNRLSEAKESNGSTQTWIQNIGYDRYGNRTSFNQQKSGEQPITQTPGIDPEKNRFTTGQGFVYDFNGNLVVDNLGRQFAFNGENKQTEVKDAANNVVGIYQYDGSGNRVKKLSVSETTIFIYNAVGKLVSEYSTQPVSSPSVNYLTLDNLGSARAITDNAGNVISRRDFMAFGEELSAGTANRTLTTKYGPDDSDSVRKRFTGYEKDSETGLDFAQARMYDNAYGRFTAIDPLLTSGKSGNPQTFNRYTYALNNPVAFTDPTGLCVLCFSEISWAYSIFFRDDASYIRYPNPYIEWTKTKTTTTTNVYAGGNAFAAKRYSRPIASSSVSTITVTSSQGMQETIQQQQQETPRVLFQQDLLWYSYTKPDASDAVFISPNASDIINKYFNAMANNWINAWIGLETLSEYPETSVSVTYSYGVEVSEAGAFKFSAGTSTTRTYGSKDAIMGELMKANSKLEFELATKLRGEFSNFAGQGFKRFEEANFGYTWGFLFLSRRVPRTGANMFSQLALSKAREYASDWWLNQRGTIPPEHKGQWGWTGR